jgi:hypothetical protein
MARWERDHCPGSVRLSQGLESKAGFAAAEGSVAHMLAEMALNGEDYRSQLGAVIQQDGFDITVDQAMIDHVTEYKVIVDDIAPGIVVRHVEHKFHLKQLHAALFGTSDCVLWHPKRAHLDVIDFKYGAGHAVEVRDNPQLLYYAVGAVMTLGYAPATITLHIVQPRCPHEDGPHRSVDVDPLDLLDFAAYMVASVKETEKPDAAIRAGDWCRYCPAAGVPGRCPAQAKAANELAKVAFTPAVQYDPDELATWLDRLPILEAQIKAVREFAYNEAEAGRCPPRYKLVEKQAREKWRPNTTAAQLLAELAIPAFAEDLLEEPSLKSPAQVRKLVPGKNDRERAAKLAAFTVKESSGHTLVSEDDKRPAIALDAKQVFARLE